MALGVFVIVGSDNYIRTPAGCQISLSTWLSLTPAAGFQCNRLRRLPLSHASLAVELTRSLHILNIVKYMPREFLGGFELLVLLALIRLGDEAYGVPIGKAIQESSGRRGG